MANLSIPDLWKLIKGAGSADPLGRVQALSITLAESGGDPQALNINQGGPAPGSHDRGLWQLNDHAQSISDADAFDPVKSTAYAYTLSKQWTDFGPWTGSHGLDQANIQSAFEGLINAGISPVAGSSNPLETLGALASKVAGKAGSIVSPFSDIISALTKLLSTIMSVEWWKRIGIAILGVVVIIIALLIIFGKDTVSSVATIGKDAAPAAA